MKPQITLDPPPMELCRKLVEVAERKGVELPDARDYVVDPTEPKTVYRRYNTDELLAMLSKLGVLVMLREGISEESLWWVSDQMSIERKPQAGPTPAVALYKILIAVLKGGDAK